MIYYPNNSILSCSPWVFLFLFTFDKLSNMSTAYVGAYFIFKKVEAIFKGIKNMLTSFLYIFLSLILRGSQETKLHRKKRYKKVEIRFENFYGSTTTKPHFSVASYTIYSRVNSLTLCVLPPVVIYTIDAVVWCLREKDVYM